MMKKYKKEIIILCSCLLICIISISFIKYKFYSNENFGSSMRRVLSSIRNEREISYSTDIRYKDAIISSSNNEDTTSVVTTKIIRNDDTTIIDSNDNKSSIPYENPPYFEDDGSIIYDGMTITELTDKLNKSLNDYLTNTGFFFADYTRKTGLNPYLSVAIVNLETGCKWSCSNMTRTCNNIGGLKGRPSCNGSSYRKFNTLGEGIDGFLDIIYNNYYLKGMTTPESMASTYAASSEWSSKVNSYMNEIKAK